MKQGIPSQVHILAKIWGETKAQLSGSLNWIRAHWETVWGRAQLRHGSRQLLGQFGCEAPVREGAWLAAAHVAAVACVVRIGLQEYTVLGQSSGLRSYCDSIKRKKGNPDYGSCETI